MIDNERILKIHDSQGNMKGVMVPADIWAEIESMLASRMSQPAVPKEDISGFKDLMQAWNYRYHYDPKVACSHCGASTRDWRQDEPRKFRLVSGNLSGLLVFHCAGCGATIRHKYFKDHVTVESSSPGAQA